jgi:hypothetical protein
MSLFDMWRDSQRSTVEPSTTTCGGEGEEEVMIRITLVDESDLENIDGAEYVPIDWANCPTCGDSVMAAATAAGQIYDGDDAYCETCGIVSHWSIDASDSDNVTAGLEESLDDWDSEVRVMRRVQEQAGWRSAWDDIAASAGIGWAIEEPA